MPKKDICIIVAAQGIPKECIKRFKNSIVESKSKYKVDIVIRGSQDKRFYKSRIINQCLRETIPNYKVIIQTDIDLVIPPRLIDKTYESLMNQPRNCFHHFLRYVDPEEVKGRHYKDYPFLRWLQLKPSFCSGCWNGMRADTWKRSGGLNEDMFGWGSEDTEFYNRSRRRGIHWINNRDFALVHINHPRRTTRRAKENFKLGNMYCDNTNWITGNIIRKSKGEVK